jgi:hypothetical protein
MARVKDDGERLHAFANAMADSVEVASDDELLADARSAGVDASQTKSHVQQLLRGVVKVSKQRRLEQAHAEYEASVAAFRTAAAKKIPVLPKEQRALLTHVFQTHPQIRSVTLQHREFSELTDSDVQSLLAQLEQLGMLEGNEGGSHGQ